MIFDWSGPGFEDDAAKAALLADILDRAFALVQVYTHLDAGAVEPMLVDVKARHPKRLLAVAVKGDVTAEQLETRVRTEWEGTIAGDTADKVRGVARRAVERTLQDMSVLSREELTALVGGRTDYLLSLILAKVRDEVGARTSDVFGEVLTGTPAHASNDAVRKLMSVWYYLLPEDGRVRRGDLVIDTAHPEELRFVVTPACHLARFSKKTAKQLTLLRVIPLQAEALAELREHGWDISKPIPGSIVNEYEKAGDSVIVLPNVPMDGRGKLADFLLLCHGWQSALVKDAKTEPSPLMYSNLPTLKRICTLAEPFVSAVASRIATTMFASGIADLSAGERNRLADLMKKPLPAKK